MDRRSRSHWRRARHNYNDLCPPIGRRAATALLWLSCSIALLRALATSNSRAQRAAARRTFLNAHHRSAAPVAPEPPNSESDPEEPEQEVSRPECPGYEQGFNYESETESESDLESDIDFDTETETAPTTEPETEPEDERGPVVPIQSAFAQSLTQRLQALRVRSPDASPNRAQPRRRPEPRSPREGEEPQPAPRAARDPEESQKPKKEQQQQRGGCKPKKPTRRDQSPRSPPRRGPIPIRRF